MGKVHEYCRESVKKGSFRRFRLEYRLYLLYGLLVTASRKKRFTKNGTEHPTTDAGAGLCQDW
jgi:hypothetical protein